MVLEELSCDARVNENRKNFRFTGNLFQIGKETDCVILQMFFEESLGILFRFSEADDHALESSKA